MRRIGSLIVLILSCAARSDSEEAPTLVLKGPSANIVAIAFQPGGRQLFALDESHAFFVWDLDTGKQIKGMEKLSRMKGDICMSFSPDGATLAAGGKDGKLMIYALDKTATKPRKLGETSDQILSIAFSPDGKTILTGTADNKVQAWDASTGESRLLDTLTKDVISLAFSEDGKTAAFGSRDGRVYTWDMGESKLNGKSKAVGSLVTALLFDTKGRVTSGTADGRVRAWSADKLKEERDAVGHSKEVTGLVKLKKGGYFASAGKDGKIQIWEDDRLTPVEDFDGGGPISAIASRPSDDALVWSVGNRAYFKVLGAKKK